MADPVHLQYQVRQNSEELQDFLKDLNRWEDDVKAQDKLLATSGAGPVSTQPVRNKPQKKKTNSKPKQPSAQAKPKLKGSDFQAWDNFDVDEALKQIDEEEEMETQSISDEDDDDVDDDDEDDEYAEQRRLQQALFEKEKGNDLFKEGKYEAAINRYTTAIGLDPYNAILPANRAMALIKMARYGAAIQDCDTALSLDKTYVKAYARRASAKNALGRLQDALEDYKQIAELQPGNKQAKEEIEKIKMMLAKKANEAAIDVDKQKDKPPMKPMKRYIIEEIGTTSSDEETAVCKRTEELTIKEDTEKPPTTIKDRTSEKTIGTENKINNIDNDQMRKNHVKEQDMNTERPVKTKAENTEYLRTNDVRDRPSEQAIHTRESTDEEPTKCGLINFDLTPPTSSIQFQATWKRLEKHPDMLYEYVKGIPPANLPKVVGESVESTLLMKMLTILRDFYVRDGLPIFTEMKYISEMKRFSMTLMFLSNEEKTVVKELLEYLFKFPEDKKTFTKDELHDLRKKYGLR